MRRNLTPSTANSWVKCPQYEPSQSGDGSQTDAMREGTAAAWLADMVLKNDATDPQDLLGRTAPSGYEINDEMVGHIRDYVNFVTSASNGKHLNSETFGEIPDIGVSGRIDADVSDSGTELHIIELKYGYRIVEPYDNWQLICYGAMKLQPQHTEIKLTIFQPRPNHPEGKTRSVTYGISEFLKQCELLYGYAVRAQNPTSEAEPTPVCSYCAKRSTCNALAQNIYAGHEYIKTQPGEYHMSAGELAAEYKFLTQLKKFIDDKHAGVESEMISRLESGEYIPGYYREPQRSNYFWKCKPVVLETLFPGINVYDKKPKTPAQLKKEGADETIINTLAGRRVNGLKITEFNQRKIDRIFKND